MKQKPLSHEEIAHICRSLARLLHAGIGGAEGISLLLEQWPVLAAASQTLEAGLPLWEALENTHAFPRSATAMVRIGEESGALEEALLSLADYHENRHRTGRLLRSALAYPAATLALMLVVVGVLLVEVLPIFDDVYASLGSRLTGIAAGLLYLGQGIRRGLPVLFGILAIFAVLLLLTAKIPALRTKAARLWNKAFGHRGIAAKFRNARFLQGLAMGIGSSMTPECAAELAAGLMEDPGSSRCRRFAQLVQNGADPAEALAETELLEETGCRMLAIGLRSGTADTVLADIARQQMTRAEEALEDAIGKIEPTLVISGSLLVGLILLSVMLPLLDILAVLG